MTRIINKITINSPVEKIWKILVNVGKLDAYDPTVQRSVVTSAIPNGLGSSRKVDMKDGRHWFKEKTTVCKPNEALTFELTECNFPINALKHSYSFKRVGNQTEVMQVMEYEVKYGLFGRILDAFMLRGQTDTGIKKFFKGLKEYAEKN